MLLIAVQADSVVLLSIFKTLVLLSVVTGWGWVVTKLDKDAAALYLSREMWNITQILAIVAGVGLWILIPYFWIGLFVALLVICGSILGYVAFRNTRVSEAARWNTSLITRRVQKKLQDDQVAVAQKQASMFLQRRDYSRIPVPPQEDAFHQAHFKLEELLEFVFLRKAERLDITVSSNQQVTAIASIDGVKVPYPNLEARLAVSLMDYLKTHAKLDVEEHRRRQQGQLYIDGGSLGQHTLMIMTSGSTRELVLSVKIDPDMRAGVGLSKLGFLEAQRLQLDPILAAGKRVILVACPPAQGQTTTLYSLMQEHDPYVHSIVTMEEEQAYEVEGIHHNLMETGVDPAAINKRLSSLLRQDPQVMMFSRLLDSQMARSVCQASSEIRFYIGMQEEDTFAAVKTWIKLVGDARVAANALGAVISQRLVRKLCVTCRAPYTPDPDALRKLNLPPDRVGQLFKQSGQVLVKNRLQTCPDCVGLAYRGRIGVFEIMALDDGARGLLGAGQLDQLRAHLRKNRMLWLQEAALARVVDGTTSIMEVTRVLTGK